MSTGASFDPPSLELTRQPEPHGSLSHDDVLVATPSVSRTEAGSAGLATPLGRLGSKSQTFGGGTPVLVHAEADSAGHLEQARALVLLCIGIFCALSIWFSASAVLAPLSRDWSITDAQGSFLTSSVNVGFCIGCFISALLGLADSIQPSMLILIGSVGSAVANATLLLVNGFVGALLSRFVVGAFLAFVYPPGVKLLSTWFSPKQQSTAIGIMFGSFCLGAAFPQLISGIVAQTSWRPLVVGTSAASAASGVLVFACLGTGPYISPSSRTRRFDVRQCAEVLRNRSVMLSILAYCGHMWELFCVWVWAATFIERCWLLPPGTASYVAFAGIVLGAPGSWIGGLLGDRYGHVRVAAASLAVSGSCVAALGLLAEQGPLALRLCIFLLWGLTALSDSPQFSAIITVHSGAGTVGTAVTLQLMCGYLITVLALWLVPHLAEMLSWRWSFFNLAAGPLIGLVALSFMRLPKDMPQAKSAVSAAVATHPEDGTSLQQKQVPRGATRESCLPWRILSG